MLNNLNLQKDMGKLEKQVAQLVMIFDKRMSDLNDRLSNTLIHLESVTERLNILEATDKDKGMGNE